MGDHYGVTSFVRLTESLSKSKARGRLKAVL